MPRPSLFKDSNGTIQPTAGEDIWVHTFPNVIRMKLNVISQLVFELVYSDVTVGHSNHNTPGTPNQ